MIRTTLCCAGAALLVAVTANAQEQELRRGETVLDRTRPELEAQGVAAGPFRIRPRVEAGPTYDSNVFATRDDKTGDVIWIVRPEITARTELERHGVSLTAGGTIARHTDNGSEDYQDYRLEAEGWLDFGNDGRFDLALRHRREHEGRGDPNVSSALAEPIVYGRSGFETGLSQAFGRIRARVFGRADHYDYDDTPRIDGSIARQDDRNRWEGAAGGRVGYAFLPDREVFVRLTYLRVLYDDTPDQSGLKRHSWGYEAVGGASFDVSGLMKGEVFAGYLARDFADARLDDFGGLGLGAELTWPVTKLTTLTGRLRRGIEETTTAENGRLASSYARTVVALRADHELLRELLLNLQLQWRTDEYSGIERTDDVLTASLGAAYTLNRHLTVSAGATYEKRWSDAADDYADTIVFVHLGVRL